MKKIFALLLLIAFTLPGCEKDDICDESQNTTPRLVISFYDAASRQTLKKVTNLRVIADGQDEPIVFFTTAVGEGRYRTSESTIKIPLNVSTDAVKFYFTNNDGNETFTNTDTLQFNYSRNNIYISRACGYSIFFLLNQGTDNPAYILNDNSPDSPEAWIKDIDVENYSLISENETHLKIYF
ncbi:DUF6452 family protein [Flavobacterium sp.]|uniref:DUF6452 family protein n=1 Tax=Flavobacterium sp. TaxID=239 RepID=UPI0039E260CD